MTAAVAPEVVIRGAQVEDAPHVHALIAGHLSDGHLLARDLHEVRRHATRFLVAISHGRIVACAELAPLSHSLAEIRSLVVAGPYQGLGIGRRLVAELRRKARLDGYHKLCAFVHRPAYFARLGFSIVPHGWLPEKIGLNCVACPFFRRCTQFAMLDDLTPVGDARARRGHDEHRAQGAHAHA